MVSNSINESVGTTEVKSLIELNNRSNFTISKVKLFVTIIKKAELNFPVF